MMIVLFHACSCTRQRLYGACVFPLGVTTARGSETVTVGCSRCPIPLSEVQTFECLVKIIVPGCIEP